MTSSQNKGLSSVDQNLVSVIGCGGTQELRGMDPPRKGSGRVLFFASGEEDGGYVVGGVDHHDLDGLTSPASPPTAQGWSAGPLEHLIDSLRFGDCDFMRELIRGEPSLVEAEVDHTSRDHPLHYTCRHQNKQALTRALVGELGASVDSLNANMETPAMICAQSGDHSIEISMLSAIVFCRIWRVDKMWMPSLS